MPCADPSRCRRSSCLVAVWLWADHGGCLAIRRGRRTADEGGGHNWWPHLLWVRHFAAGGTVVEGREAWRKFRAGWHRGHGYLLIDRDWHLYWVQTLDYLQIAHMQPCPSDPRRQSSPPILFRGCIVHEDQPHGQHDEQQ